MKTPILKIATLSLLLIAVPMAAQAGTDFVPYKPGIVKSAIAKGETALLFFKSTW